MQKSDLGYLSPFSRKNEQNYRLISDLKICFLNHIDLEKAEKEKVEKAENREKIADCFDKLSTFDERGLELELQNSKLEFLMRKIERDNCVLHSKIHEIKQVSSS